MRPSLLKYEKSHFLLCCFLLFHGYLSSNSNLKGNVVVFNTTELLRYEKAHCLRSLVSARVKTLSMLLALEYPATYLHLFE